MVEHLLEVIQKPRILHDRLHPQPEPKVMKTSKNLEMFMDRLRMRRWIEVIQEQLMEAIVHLRSEVKFIEHLPGCWMCQMELKLDVERLWETIRFGG